MGGVHHPLGDGREARSFHGRADHPAGQETGAKKADVCRKHGVNGATFISEKFGGLDVLDASSYVRSTSGRSDSSVPDGFWNCEPPPCIYRNVLFDRALLSRGARWRWLCREQDYFPLC